MNRGYQPVKVEPLQKIKTKTEATASKSLLVYFEFPCCLRKIPMRGRRPAGNKIGLDLDYNVLSLQSISSSLPLITR